MECVNTGRKVIEMAEYFRPDIVFMDIQMPGINGIEAMREIRQGNDNTIFIVVSAFLKFDYAKDAIDIGVLEYLNKPVDKEQIVRVLKKAMMKVDEEQTPRGSGKQGKAGNRNSHNRKRFYLFTSVRKPE